MSIEQIGALTALYPATWGVAQLVTGAWSDRVGRKWLIVGCVIAAFGFPGFAVGVVLLGIGTAMVNPTLLAGLTAARLGRLPRRRSSPG